METKSVKDGWNDGKKPHEVMGWEKDILHEEIMPCGQCSLAAYEPCEGATWFCLCGSGQRHTSTTRWDL